jgi:7-carboxy-7-deazaguanine synthase (Cx14CxxC type)
LYSVKEIFFTLQGEGVHAGRPAVFCRFAGCNLWTGLEKDRGKAVCKFCDTDFVGIGPDGGKFATAAELAARVADAWPADQASGTRHRYVVCTGGEPLLQLDAPLIDAFHAAGFEVGVETNGTQPAPPGIDWLCVSPKANAPLVLTNGDELKLVYPQTEPAAQPDRFTHLGFRHFSLQPMDGPALAENTRQTVQYCLTHPRWRLSLQTHKLLGLR